MELYSQQIKVGSEVWLPSQETVWELATVLAITDSLATVRTEKDDVVQVDLATVPCYLANPTVAADICSLHYIHEPGILYALEQRSAASEPYTMLGSVLVAINPLRRIPDPEGILGKKRAATQAHPYGIAEVAYSQMVFAENRKMSSKKTDEVIVSNQSIVISGESGAGKTESAKMCLRHLVSRNEGAGGMHNLDERLLSSNPILEAFGNASTVRNHNSSRFGKFLKLHFSATPRPGDAPAWTIGGASIVTYLLERSRITTHNMGERGYHVFYQLRDGSPADIKAELGLDKTSSFTYMTPNANTKAPVSGTKLKVNDVEDYAALDKAFNSLGISPQLKMEVYKTLAGILHLGNVEFENDERPEGDVAVPKKGGYGAVEWAAKLLGVEADALILMLVETEIKTGTEMVKKRRDANAATFARDAVAKAAYSQLFEWTVETVNHALVLQEGTDVEKLPFIGVLDIFGFESFERNDFEQLLINYANEALQGTFNRQVFQAELDLYKREGLIVDDGGMPAPPDNSECMRLLAGEGKTPGLLKVIDAECQTPQANDQKMNKMIQKTFEKNPCMMKPHPKDAATTFIVRHYAGAVVYTVGRFIEKNADRLPKEVGATFEKSKVAVVRGLFSVKDKAEAAKRAFGGASIIGKFVNQIAALIETLESTRDSFIRCVKPCTAMVRTEDIKGWYDRRYVTMQLKCLSIPQTAEVLKSGLPTRVPYEVLTENYMNVLPKAAIDMWKSLGGGDLKSFMSALFWAFEVPENSYRCGTTRVFFKSGELTLLDNIMESASKWAGTEDPQYAMQRDRIVKRFKYYYVRALWRKSIVKIMCFNRFNRLILAARKRLQGATRIEALFRMNHARLILKRNQRGAIMAQKLWRAKIGRRVAAQRRAEAIEEAKRKAEEAKRLEEEARKRAEEERIAAEQARIAAEEARKKAEEERVAAEAAAAAAAEEERAAMQAKLADLLKQQAEARVVEEARMEEEKKRAAEAEAEAERLRKLREAAEQEEQAAVEAERLAREKEEREAAEQKKRWEEEEAARQKAEDEAAAAGAPKGRGTVARKKSVVRQLKGPTKPDGVTKEEKARRIEVAEEAIAKEKEQWANSGRVGYLMKQEKAGIFGGKKWKPLFFMLKMVKCELEIYPKANSSGLVGEPKGKPKQVFVMTKGKVTAEPHSDAKLAKGAGADALLRISDPKSGELILGCKDTAERESWMASIARASSGFIPSQAAADALDKAKALPVISAEVAAAFTAGAEGEKETVDISKLPPAAQEQLAKIDSLLETGLLSQEEVDQLRPVILAQAKEMMATMSREAEDEFPINGPVSTRATVAGKGRAKGAYRQAKQVQNQDEMLGYSSNTSPAVMVVCEVCSILNAHGGTYCSVCSARLPKADAPAQQERVKAHRASMAQQQMQPQYLGQPDFGPPDGKWLCEMPYMRVGTSVMGTFRAFIKDAVTVMDNQTWEQTALYIVACEWQANGMIPQIEQWTSRHNWRYYEKTAPKLADTGLIPSMPEFPQVTANEATSTRTETMKRLKVRLSEWLGALLASVQANVGGDPSKSQVFLENDVVDKFFKIKENVQAEIDQYADVYAMIKGADFGAADSSTPLNLEEMTNADDAATLLLTYLSGDGGQSRALNIYDERVQDMRAVCLTAIPRLKISSDPENPSVYVDLIPQALDVLDHVERALQAYTDSEWAAIHGNNLHHVQ